MRPISAPPVPAHPTGAAPRIVVALSARERALFFELPPPAGWVWLNDSEISPEGWEQRLESLQPVILITGWQTPPLPERWLLGPGCPLRYVCHVVGSVRQLVPRGFLVRGGIVTNWGESVSRQVAEHGLLLALAALRQAAHWPAFIARPVAARRIEELGTKTLFGRRVGLHGFGGVARALLPLLAPFSVSLAAYSAGVPAELMATAGVRPCASLDELFSTCDVLFECEALTPATERSVSAAVLAALADGAVFVNIGRGGVVDDAALQREAWTGRLRIALDVASDEPLTSDSPYVLSGNVTLSPHIAGPTRDRYGQCGALALAHLDAFLRGQVPATAITLAAYDRAT